MRKIGHFIIYRADLGVFIRVAISADLLLDLAGSLTVGCKIFNLAIS